jgi:hypothetical protein
MANPQESLADIGAFYSGDSQENVNDNDKSILPITGDILGTALQEQGFPMKSRSPDNIGRQVVEVALDKKVGSINYSKSAPDDSSDQDHSKST